MANPYVSSSGTIPTTIIYPSNSKSFTTLVLARIGSRFESPELSGISHFVEHMLFKSTKKRNDSKKIAMDIEMMGGITNAFTSYEYTGYFIKSSPLEYEKTIEILSDIIRNTVFKKEEFEKERGVILEEIKMYQDRPTSKVAANWRKVFYGEHPLGRDIAGTLDTITKMKVTDLEKFYAENYFKDNFVIVSAGKIKNKENILAEIKTQFNDTYDHKSNKRAVEIPVNKISDVLVEDKDLEQAHVYLGFEVSKRSLETEIISDLLNVIMSEGFGSRLFQKLREEMGIAYYLYSDFSLFNDGGRMNVGFGTDLKQLERVIEEVIKELNLLIREGVNMIELERAKKYYVSRLLFDTEASDELASWIGTYYIEDGILVTLEDTIKKIQKLTVEDINNYLKTEFSGKEILISVLGKLKRNLKDKFNLKLD